MSYNNNLEKNVKNNLSNFYVNLNSGDIEFLSQLFFNLHNIIIGFLDDQEKRNFKTLLADNNYNKTLILNMISLIIPYIEKNKRKKIKELNDFFKKGISKTYYDFPKDEKDIKNWFLNKIDDLDDVITEYHDKLYVNWVTVFPDKDNDKYKSKIKFDLIIQNIDNKYFKNSYLDENKYLDIIKNNAKKYLNQINYYHYKLKINNKKVNTFYTKNQTLFSQKKNILDVIFENKRWTSFFALDWLSQINFFYRCKYSNIIFVTGATGVGKSSQVPKLLLHFYEVDKDVKTKKPKICVSQPRIKPTIDNTRNISNQIGLPTIEFNKIKKFDDNLDYTDITSYTRVRYSYKGNESISSYDHFDNIENNNLKYQKLTNTSNITFMTDGKMIDLFRFYDNKNKLKIINKKWNSIIIDEVHEHNKNMDIILTLYKKHIKSLVQNNIKLIIISATMDNDEARFRNYYNITESKAKNVNYYFNKRIHLFNASKEGTLYQIKEKYYFDTPTNKNIKELIKLGIEISIQKILNNKGNLLFFVATKKQVKNSVKALIEKTPNNILILPVYGGLDQDSEIINKLVSNFDNFKNDYIINKNKIYDYLEGKESIKESKKGYKSPYKNVIIVGTNVAEASITIGNLFYVVDLGISVLLQWINELQVVKQSLTRINYTNRIQRKGRVGRIQPGEVIYLYSKGETEKVPFYYDISNSEFDQLLYDLISSSVKTPEEIYDLQGDFYIIHPEENYIKRDSNFVIKNLKKENTKQYYSVKKYLKYKFLKISPNNNFILTQLRKEIKLSKLKNSEVYFALYQGYHLLNKRDFKEFLDIIIIIYILESDQFKNKFIGIDEIFGDNNWIINDFEYNNSDLLKIKYLIENKIFDHPVMKLYLKIKKDYYQNFDTESIGYQFHQDIDRIKNNKKNLVDLKIKNYVKNPIINMIINGFPDRIIDNHNLKYRIKNKVLRSPLVHCINKQLSLDNNLYLINCSDIYQKKI